MNLRLLHHLHHECVRGEYITSYTDYDERWLNRIAKERAIVYSDLTLPTPKEVHLCQSLKVYTAYKQDRRLTKGEKQINNITRVMVSDTSKHDYYCEYSLNMEANLREALPDEVKNHDLQLAQSLLNANIAKSTRKNLQSVQRILTALVPERDVFKDPKPGDKDLLLLRSLQHKPNITSKTRFQYLKSYNSILWAQGVTPPPDSPWFSRMKTGVQNKNFNPRQMAETPKRQAHTKETLAMLAHAFHNMSSKAQGLWEQLRVQAIHTATLIAFWACARLSDLCGAESTTSYSVRTTLLEEDLTLMIDQNEIIGLELFFGSEKIQHLNGSRVQLPKMPDGPLKKLCPVRAYLAYQKLKRNLNPTPKAPWLIDYNGKPITQRALNAYIDKAIETTYGNTEHMHFLRKLRGHSFRAALPTHMQAMGESLTREEKKLMGRWLTEEAYQLYCKDKASNRLQIAKLVAQHMMAN